MSDCESNKVKIIKGEDKIFFVKLTDAETGDVFDLSSATAIKAIFKGSSSNVEVTMADSEIAVVSPAVNGKIEVTISDTKSALLKDGLNLPVEIEIDEGTKKTIVQILNALDVTARI